MRPRAPGDSVVLRDILHGRPWFGWGATVVEDNDEGHVVYVPEGAPMADGEHPVGPHPWGANETWAGSGVLIVTPRDALYAIWHFWRGPGGEFSNWYVNFQRPAAATPIGFDTQDLELDIVVLPDGSWLFKDEDLFPQRVEEGKFSQATAAAVRAVAGDIAAELDRGQRRWDDKWVGWRPDPKWPRPVLPSGWQDVPTPISGD